MNPSASSNALSPLLAAEAERADRLAQSGQEAIAAQAYEALLEKIPDYSRALAFLAMRAYRHSDLDGALVWIDKAVRGQPRLAMIEAQRGQILEARGDQHGSLSAYQAALEIDPGFVPARFDAGRLLESMGRSREANAHYDAALSQLPASDRLPGPLRQRVEQAQASMRREHEELEAFIQSRLSGISPPITEAGDRFTECFEIFMGRMKPMPSKPGMMHFPKLAPITFHPRDRFPWLAQLEAATDSIRDEMLAVMETQQDRFIPYVQKNDVAPGTVWEPLNHKDDWGVYFLYNQGERVEAHTAACPATTAALDALPLVRIPGRGPTAFFSRLKPGTHIPAHHGATNTRLICHLPLVVPSGCRFRVGNDVREWREGHTMIFDDTIEHEAWNDGQQDRIVLIFDVWNPFLDERERELVSTMTAALAEFYPERQHKTDF